MVTMVYVVVMVNVYSGNNGVCSGDGVFSGVDGVCM